METWLTYELQDFLLFSRETYWRLFERANGDGWLPALGLGAVLLVLTLTAWRTASTRRVAGVIVAIALVCTALLFVRALYQPINFAAGWIWPLLIATALLTLVSLRTDTVVTSTRRRLIGLTIIAAGVAWPLLTLLTGRPIAQAEVFGVAPDPTVIVALGYWLTRVGWAATIATLIGVILGLASALTLLALAVPTAWPVAGLCVLVPITRAVLRER